MYQTGPNILATCILLKRILNAPEIANFPVLNSIAVAATFHSILHF